MSYSQLPSCELWRGILSGIGSHRRNLSNASLDGFGSRSLGYMTEQSFECVFDTCRTWPYHGYWFILVRISTFDIRTPSMYYCSTRDVGYDALPMTIYF